MMAAGLGLPLPEDIPLILAGLVVSTGRADLAPMILVGLVGVIMGDSTLFLMGRRYGTGILEHRWFRRIAKPWLVNKARQKYEHHGAKILFVARFMPGLRSVLFLTAGTFRVPYWKLLVFDGSAALISVPLWIWAGYYFSGRVEAVFASARYATYTILGVLAGALIIWAFWEYYHNLRKRNGVERTPESGSDALPHGHAADVPSPAVPIDAPVAASGEPPLPTRPTKECVERSRIAAPVE